MTTPDDEIEAVTVRHVHRSADEIRKQLASLVRLHEQTHRHELIDQMAEYLAGQIGAAEADERDRIADWMNRHAYPAQAVRLIREGKYR